MEKSISSDIIKLNSGFRISKNQIARLLLVFCLIDFSGMWLYASGSDPLSAIDDSIRSYPQLTRYPIWALSTIMAIASVIDGSIISRMRPLIIFMPFAIIGVILIIVAVSPAAATRAVALWCVMAWSASAIGEELGYKETINLTSVVILSGLCLSLLAVIMVPELATQPFDLRGAWRGIFSHKNYYGWMSSIALVFAVCFRSIINRYVSLSMIVVSISGILLSHSSSSFINAFATIFFVAIASTAIWKKSSATIRLILLIYASISLYFLFQVSVDLILTSLGRDATFTGRTLVWQVYLNLIEPVWAYGFGAGSFSSGSNAVTDRVFVQLSAFGAIASPHNMYIGALGETGILGLISFVGALIYAIVGNIRLNNSLPQFTHALSFIILVAGFSETHEIYAPGIGVFLLILFRSAEAKG